MTAMEMCALISNVLSAIARNAMPVCYVQICKTSIRGMEYIEALKFIPVACFTRASVHRVLAEDQSQVRALLTTIPTTSVSDIRNQVSDLLDGFTGLAG